MVVTASAELQSCVGGWGGESASCCQICLVFSNLLPAEFLQDLLTPLLTKEYKPSCWLSPTEKPIYLENLNYPAGVRKKLFDGERGDNSRFARGGVGLPAQLLCATRP